MVKKLLLLFFGSILALLLFSSVLTSDLLLLLALLAGGSIFAAGRLWESANIPWPAVMAWLTGLMVLAVGTHAFCAWLRSGPFLVHQVEPEIPDGQPGPVRRDRRWPWRWTLGLVGGFWLLLLSGMSLVGVVHQVGWMAVSGEPIFVDRYRGKMRSAYDMRLAADLAEQTAHSNHWRSVETRAAYWKHYQQARLSTILESVDVIFLEGTDGRLDAVLVIGGMPTRTMASGQCIILKPGQPLEFMPAKELPALLQLHARNGTVP